MQSNDTLWLVYIRCKISLVHIKKIIFTITIIIIIIIVVIIIIIIIMLLYKSLNSVQKCSMFSKVDLPKWQSLQILCSHCSHLQLNMSLWDQYSYNRLWYDKPSYSILVVSEGRWYHCSRNGAMMAIMYLGK